MQDRMSAMLFTNRKSHTSFRMTSKLVTLNNREERNGRYTALFYGLGASRPILSAM